MYPEVPKIKICIKYFEFVYIKKKYVSAVCLPSKKELCKCKLESVTVW